MRMNEDEIMSRESMSTKTILLCTFVKKQDLCKRLQLIKKAFKVDRNRVFVLNDNTTEYNRFILTYNIVVPRDDEDQSNYNSISHTFRINRNKEYNSLYTVGALNELIREEYGEYQKNAMVDWSRYPNCLLLIDRDSDELLKIDTSINHIEII